EQDAAALVAGEAEAAGFVDQADVADGELAAPPGLADFGRAARLDHQRQVRREAAAARRTVGDFDRCGLDREELAGAHPVAVDRSELRHSTGEPERQARER